MKTLNLIPFILLVVFVLKVNSQNNVGFGTTTPDASALLDLTATDKGLLIPRVTLNNASLPAPVTAPAEGLLIYNYNGSEAHGFWYWDGSQWMQVGSGSSGCATLDDSYNCGGNGVGRIINANFGAVQINLSSITGGTEGLAAFSTCGASGTPTSAIYAENSSYGGGIYAVTNNSANAFNTIEASSNSNNQYTSAIAGYYDGTGQGVGVYGSVYNAGSSGYAGVLVVNNRTNGGWGVEGSGYNGSVGFSAQVDGFGIYGGNTNTSTNVNDDCVGVCGDGKYGVWGQTSWGIAGTFGLNTKTTGGWGVEGNGFNGTIGLTTFGQGYGIYGENMDPGVIYNNIGVAGLGWVGVWGETNDFSTGYGVYANGDFASTGAKSFMIDHPSDPENKFLKHFSAESPEILNIYRGTTVLNSNGEAIVELPDYFEAINKNFSYQLTPVGASAPGLFIKQEISNGKFLISGGQPNLKVCWTVYSERNDAYLQKYPEKRNVEIDKRDGAKGNYLMPGLYNQPDSKKIFQPLDTNMKKAQEKLKPGDYSNPARMKKVNQ
ncbi:MAG: hypothetical protein ABIJ97_03350 [Bacteroidota bacterium]